MQHRMRGFTAVELMVVLSIVAILSAIAMPSFSHLVAKLQVEKDIEAFRASVMLARSEAMKQGGNVRLTKITAATAGLPNDTCSGAQNWSCGWEVVNTSVNPPQVVRQYLAKGTNDMMLASGTGGSVDLNRWGLPKIGFSVNFEHKKYKSADFNKRVCISTGGSVRVADNCS